MGADEPFLYDEALARHYDADYAVLRHAAGDVRFYQELARASGGPVLEVGCGTGRVLLPLARAGLEVTGVDPSPAMLALLEERLRAEPPAVRERVTLRRGTFAHLGLEGPFALVAAPFRGFQHLLDDEARLAGLQEMARVLAPHGRLAFDCFDFDPGRAAARVDEQVDYRLEDGRRLRERRSSSRWDAAAGVLRGRFRWLVDGELEDEAGFVMAVPGRDAILALLPRAGLELVALWADFQGAPWRPGHPRELVFLARPAGSREAPWAPGG